MSKSSGSVFREQVESFATLIDALLKKPRTRSKFEADPMGTLEAHGIKCEDPEKRAMLQEELLAASGRATSGPPGTQAVAIPFVVAVVAVEAAVRIGSEARILETEKRIFEVDHSRVDMFLDSAAMQDRINELEAEVSMLRKRVGGQ